MKPANDPTPLPCKVLLVDDHPMFREHLARLIKRDLGMVVAGETDNVADAMRLIGKTHPDIAIVDISLRGASGLDLVKNIHAADLPVRVLVLSMHAEELYGERALQAGARGYITKNEASSKVVEAIRSIHRGEVYAGSITTTRLVDRLSRRRTSITLSGTETLADRELEVFQKLGRGISTRDIAAKLEVAESTVETYRARIKEKLNLRSAAELYLRAGEWVREHGC